MNSVNVENAKLQAAAQEKARLREAIVDQMKAANATRIDIGGIQIAEENMPDSVCLNGYAYIKVRPLLVRINSAS